MNALVTVDVRLQLARALDGLVSPGSDLQSPGWPWRWPERDSLEQPPIEPSWFVRDWVEAGQRHAPAAPLAVGSPAGKFSSALRCWLARQ